MGAPQLLDVRYVALSRNHGASNATLYFLTPLLKIREGFGEICEAIFKAIIYMLALHVFRFPIDIVRFGNWSSSHATGV